MRDDYGVEWYRYDKPVWEYSIEEITFTGDIRCIQSGTIDRDMVNLPCEGNVWLFFVDSEGEPYVTDYLHEDEEIYSTKVKAERRIAELKENEPKVVC